MTTKSVKTTSKSKNVKDLSVKSSKKTVLSRDDQMRIAALNAAVAFSNASTSGFVPACENVMVNARKFYQYLIVE